MAQPDPHKTGDPLKGVLRGLQGSVKRILHYFGVYVGAQ